ncbi:MAG: pantetheine-phosphate adenylyltransferase [Gammaproteobacteria bacterium]|jgi:pantetheine-phosphate adenylyltransferase|nr:pantetheine-phosphate adenylyltransferase [Gammaproteobacteria bacterium]MBT5406598.1 pantetheine-phosphate adenylyltransferase [Gammaproteobacteria bacterium]MBT5644406.1 pantetheine-phosphate adenylyltransferase [Gammaproteobacteria bacterium]MBT5862917.1 pantetheine-phosphate adenylyltransferase [Gammaproteobacteria bacterium]MBT6734383.1 pantetheine-phosphate adenylyltransferase [Gammaproteobacteria bacterium]|tara:strand:- start:2576 stop:3055 length:480 start_codon:yes stop_codon:yes gene_type:complete
MEKIAVYPGTFDPITNGHTDLAKRGCKIFDKIIIAVAENPQKNTLFSITERIDFVKNIFSDEKKIEVYPLNKLLVEFAKDHSATVILRGLRAVSDFEYEVQLASMNRSMEPNIESVFMSPAEKFGFLSSSIIKDIARHGGKLEQFVHKNVLKALRKKYS